MQWGVPLSVRFGCTMRKEINIFIKEVFNIEQAGRVEGCRTGINVHAAGL